MNNTDTPRYLSTESNIELDPEGYLVDLSDWSETVAGQLADDEGIELTPEHWEIINLVRSFYARYEMAPAMRPLVKATQRSLGEEKGRSIYLMRLFPGSTAKVVARIAGLPKPTNCL
ncbi:TusE/DsrC/DsvC family sulfur relay protein [Vreelandella arcis]|uniref:Sulfurtransferase n=1 Tax=Vreelandella arcis TaxID=416873 RepID=A0A1G9YS84_9GAMM|nr:TusE/DsrC/DsvC family sulfur relay protein [Halomonas arcis]SDN11266.1 tRNA 2-thiouridine synthesizing protein E [Halomonas arcis]